MEGAINVARNGFVVNKDLVKYAEYTISDSIWNFLVEDPVWAEEFAPNGRLIEAGDTMYRTRYANTLERIANEGSSAFYEGEIAESMMKTIQKTNGTMTLEDLKNYEIISRKVHSVPYRNHTLHTIGSPANGAVTINILKAMEMYPPGPSITNLDWHRYTEAMRFAYSARLKLGDPEFVPGIDKMEDEMMTDDTAKRITEMILDNTTMPIEYYDPDKLYTADGEGTSQIATADKSGMAVSLTTTVNLLFGAQIMDPLSGVIL